MDGLEFYDMDGNVLTMEEWVKIYGDMGPKRIVEQTRFPNGYMVSTVLLGFDHGFGSKRPVIFETMVFSDDDENANDNMERYCTKEEAIAGHKRFVARFAKLPKPSRQKKSQA